jgi:hypothetical protein
MPTAAKPKTKRAAKAVNAKASSRRRMPVRPAKLKKAKPRTAKTYDIKLYKEFERGKSTDHIDDLNLLSRILFPQAASGVWAGTKKDVAG